MREAAVPSVKIEYDPCARCIDELVHRFEGRGILRSVQREATSQARTAKMARAIAPDAYRNYGFRSEITDRYRTGLLGDMRYMTSEDFVRYYRARRQKSPANIDLPTMAVVKRPGGAYPLKKEKTPLLRPATAHDRKQVEKYVARLPESVKEKHPAIGERMAEMHRWLRSDEIRPSEKRRSFPISAASAILVFTISFALIVSGSVMKSDANAEYRSATEVLSELQAEEDDLTRRLAVKNDLAEIEDYAKNQLGMVEKTYVSGEYLGLEREEKVGVYQEEEAPAFGLDTLLSALGLAD